MRKKESWRIVDPEMNKGLAEHRFQVGQLKRHYTLQNQASEAIEREEAIREWVRANPDKASENAKARYL